MSQMMQGGNDGPTVTERTGHDHPTAPRLLWPGAAHDRITKRSDPANGHLCQAGRGISPDLNKTRIGRNGCRIGCDNCMRANLRGSGWLFSARPRMGGVAGRNSSASDGFLFST